MSQMRYRYRITPTSNREMSEKSQQPAAPEPRMTMPWSEVLAFGLGVLRLSPKAFWAMTPRELNAAFYGVTGGQCHPVPMARGELEKLMQRFPDA